MARFPEWIPTPEILQQIESHAARGLTEEQIAYCLDIAPPTLSTKKKTYPEIDKAIKKGSGKGILVIANALFENGKAGNVAAQIFFLKNRAKWSDTAHENDELRAEIKNMRQMVQEWMQQKA